LKMYITIQGNFHYGGTGESDDEPLLFFVSHYSQYSWFSNS